MADRARCSVCLAEFQLKKDGTLRWHCGDEYQGRWRQMCRGVGEPPAVMRDRPGLAALARAVAERRANRG